MFPVFGSGNPAGAGSIRELNEPQDVSPFGFVVPPDIAGDGNVTMK